MEEKKPTIGYFHPQTGHWCVAAEKAGYKHLWAYENNKRVLRTLHMNFLKLPIYLHPQSLFASNLESPDVIGGSPPCSGFSTANPFAGPGDPRNKETILFAKAVRKFKPKAFVLEMVPPFKTSERFRKIYNKFKTLLKDYTLNEKVVDFSMLGVAQKRRRYMVIGAQGKKISFPVPGRFTTIRDAFEGLPKLSLEEAMNAQLISGSFRKRGPPPKMKGKRMVQLDWDWISPTVTSSTGETFMHPDGERTLTILEAKRLMQLPDDYKLYGGKSTHFAQIAEGVPVEALSQFLRVVKEAIV